MHLTHTSVREIRQRLASVAIRLGATEQLEAVTTADIIEALDLLRIFVLMSKTRMGKQSNAIDGAQVGQLIIELDLLRELV